MNIIIGIDEVGRGPWAGPLVAAAVALPLNCRIKGLKDSKKLNHLQRVELLPLIKRKAISIGIGWVDNAEIDKNGLTWANRTAMQRALAQFNFDYNEIVIDGSYNYLKDSYQLARAEIKADRRFPCVSAASIIAKVARDAYMQKLAAIYPNYGFEKHVGYGTKEHQTLLTEFGPSAIHRLSFKPLVQYST